MVMRTLTQQGFKYNEYAASPSAEHILPRPPDKQCIIENYFSYFSTKTLAVGTQKNHFNQTGFFSTQMHV